MGNPKLIARSEFVPARIDSLWPRQDSHRFLHGLSSDDQG